MLIILITMFLLHFYTILKLLTFLLKYAEQDVYLVMSDTL